MANTLGTVDLGTISWDYSFEDDRVSISGYVTSKSALDDVRDLFSKAKGNTMVERILGGIWKGIDLTTDYENWKEGTFDPEQLNDGWYLMLGFKHYQQQKKNNYPYTVELQWFKTTDVTGESVGTGDGTVTVYNLDNPPVTPTSEDVYLGGTLTTAYTIKYDEGEITFDSAPGNGVAITADYAYFV